MAKYDNLEARTHAPIRAVQRLHEISPIDRAYVLLTATFSICFVVTVLAIRRS